MTSFLIFLFIKMSFSGGLNSPNFKSIRVGEAEFNLRTTSSANEAPQTRCFFRWRERFERERRRREREKNRPPPVADKGRFFEWQSPRERNRTTSEGSANGWRQRYNGTRKRS